MALSASPGRSVLTRDVVVYSSLGSTEIAWSAASDQAWLSVSPSGKTGGALKLTANPTALAVDKTHFATVKVTAKSAENQETIRVGLHVLQGAPQNASIAVEGHFLAASPVEPIVFVTNGGTDVLGFDVFSGAQVRTLPNVVANAGALTLSGDGRSLFVFDRNNLRAREVDATTGALVRSYPSPDSNGSGLLYLRPSAYPTLIVPSAAMYDAVSGAALPNASLLSIASLMASADGTLVVDESGTVHRVGRSASEATVERLFNAGTAQGRLGQACLSADGTTVYTASGYPYNFPGVSFLTQQTVQVLPGSSYPSSVVCAWNNLIIGGIDGYYDATDIWVYDGPSGVELAKLSSAVATSYRTLVHRGLAVSGDGSRLISLSVDSNHVQRARFQSLPTAP